MKLRRRCGRQKAGRASAAEFVRFYSPLPWRAGRRVQPLFTPVSVTEWANRIMQTCQRDAANTLELARLLSRARADLEGRGQWSQLLRLDVLPFEKAKADRLVLVGRTFTASRANASIWRHLPCSCLTLYRLAQLGGAKVRQLIIERRIHPGLTLREAKALLAKHRPDAAEKAPALAFRNWMARMRRSLRKNAANWSDEERLQARAEFLTVAAQFDPQTQP
jgi:hypothetical protein